MTRAGSLRSGTPAAQRPYTYNALGQRMKLTVGTAVTRYVYDGDRVLEETNDAGTVQARYTTAAGSYYAPLLHIWRVSDSLSRFPVYDLTGSARGLLDAAGGVTDTYTLEAFGKQRAGTGSTPNPYRFGGAWGYINGGSGLQQLGARFYWPDIGRFVSQDPMGDGMNWYRYAAGNPVVWIDPSGLVDWGRVARWIDCYASLAEQGALAWFDGVIPFGDPLANRLGLYDPSDPAFQFGRMMGGVSRDEMIAASGAANLTEWLSNWRMYEYGQRALPNEVYRQVAHLNPVARGIRLTEMFPGGAPDPGLLTYIKIGLTTGPTPPGGPIYAGLVHGGDRLASGRW